MNKPEHQLIWETYSQVEETTATSQNIDRIKKLKRDEAQDGASPEDLKIIQQVLDELITMRNEIISAEAGKTKKLLLKIKNKFKR